MIQSMGQTGVLLRPTTAAAQDAGRASGFASALAGLQNAASGDHAQLEQQAQKLVAQVFLAPIFKQMRQSPFRSSWLDGGRGGQAFAGLYDQHLLDRIAKSVGPKLTGALVRRIQATEAYAKQQKAPPTGQSEMSDPKSQIQNPKSKIQNPR